jgi:ketosteroid isomerase-like protein
MMSAKEVLERYKSEINSHDFSRLEPFISENCKFWFSSGTYVGIEATRKAFEKTWDAIKNEIYSVADVEWLCDGDRAAVCTYTFHWEGNVGGERRKGKGRGTSCFRLEDNDWKIVHEHLSPFPA